jgi:hypothetical protein
MKNRGKAHSRLIGRARHSVRAVLVFRTQGLLLLANGAHGVTRPTSFAGGSHV